MVTIKYFSNEEEISYEDVMIKKLPFDSLSFGATKIKLEETTCESHTSEIILNLDTEKLHINYCCDLSRTKWHTN